MKKFFLSLAVLAMSFATVNADSEVIRRSFKKEVHPDMVGIDVDGDGEISNNESILPKGANPCKFKLVYSYIKGDSGIADIELTIGKTTLRKRVYKAVLTNLDVEDVISGGYAIVVSTEDNDRLIAMVAYDPKLGNMVELGDIMMFTIKRNVKTQEEE